MKQRPSATLDAQLGTLFNVFFPPDKPQHRPAWYAASYLPLLKKRREEIEIVSGVVSAEYLLEYVTHRWGHWAALSDDDRHEIGRIIAGWADEWRVIGE